ncbi:MAG: hypothetical protein NVS2B6_07550 [Thermoleophilaceae bacterium]
MIATVSSAEPCSWCGRRVEPGEGYRLAELPGARRAAFCRLEHLVPWAIKGAHWTAGEAEGSDAASSPRTCAQCGIDLDDVRLVLVSHRGEHRVPDTFCSVDHTSAWARAGGRYR